MLYSEDSIDLQIPDEAYYYFWTFFGEEFFEVRAPHARVGTGKTQYYRDLPTNLCLIWRS